MNISCLASMSSSFMKQDEYIPNNLLAFQRSLPFVTNGLGQFVEYDKRARAQVALSSLAQMPRRQSRWAAGYDLVASEDVVVPARGSAVVDTGVCVGLPEGHYGRVAGRSSLAFKHDVSAFEGTIDEDYRGRIMVKLFNHSDEEFKTGALTRIAQLIIQPYSTPAIDVVEELEDSERGTGGFGSTGSI